MKYDNPPIEVYIENIQDEEKKQAIIQLREIINANLPKGFQECVNYGMPSWVVPKSLYPQGYHCDTSLPLPFLSIAAQKNYISVYHMCCYSDKNLHDWFAAEYARQFKFKLDMGKSCIRFKKTEAISYDLIGELCTKITPEDYISIYESTLKK